jgi:beta-glucosidase
MPEPHELLNELTPDERVRMLHQHSPAVPRLGLPAWHTGAEVLHGVAWNGVATVFPQAIGLASAWNPELLEEVGRAVAAELHAMRAENPDLGLNVWAPVVNPLRNPRWGRNEEGYSEDPTLTAQCATAFTRGLRGLRGPGGPGGAGAAWATAPTLKHFVGYNNETDRDVTSSSLSERVLREYELPAFAGPLRAGSVAAVMASYNLVNGIPAHVSPLLDVLRQVLDDPDDLAIVSDAGAPSNLWRSERFVPDAAHAVAAALAAGVDSFTDDGPDSGPIVTALDEALEAGLLSPSLVDRAVLRLFRLRSKTGELEASAAHDGPPADALREAHRSLALQAATESIVVLSNPAGALPLAAEEPVAVVGALGQRVLTDWYSGSLPYAATIADGLGATATARGNDRVRLRAGDGFLAVGAAGELGLESNAAEFWLERWGWDVVTLRDAASEKLVTVADGAVSATADTIGGWFVNEAFELRASAGRLAPQARMETAAVTLRHRVSGEWLGVVDGGVALVDEPFEWALDVTEDGIQASVAAATGRTAVIVVGNDPHLHGRETEDRPSVELPEPDRELVAAVAAAAERSVLVIVSSYPFALGGLADQVDAVVWTSHGGQELGNAVAVVLTGAAEPRGRLTQSWPASDEQVHELLDYDIVGSRQTYLYSEAPAAYPFGHGLHYGSTELTDARLSVSSVAAGPVTDPDAGLAAALVTVRNTSGRFVDEVVQLYVGAAGEPRRPFPRRRLTDWRRARLAPGESARLEFAVPASALAQWDPRAGRWHLEPGDYRVLVGRSSEDLPVELGLTAVGPSIAPVPAGAAHPLARYDDGQGVELVTDPATGVTAVRPRTDEVRLRFVDVELGPERRIDLLGAEGSGTVDVVAGSPTGEARSAVTVEEDTAGASVTLHQFDPGTLVDLELSWRGALAITHLRAV